MGHPGKILSIAVTAFLFIVLCGIPSSADETPSANPYSGDFLTRSTLTGDWGGFRNDLAAKGVTLDLDLTQITQGVTSGGKRYEWEYEGRGQLLINVDTQKLGLWPGGFLTMEVEGKFGQSANSHTGAIMPVNTNHIFPLPGENLQLNVPQITFAQFLSHYGGIVFGKFDTTSGDMNEFAHGKGDKQFQNLALNFNPAVLFGAPYSVLGAGIIVLPTKDPKAAIVTVSVLDTNGKPDVSGFDSLSGDHISVAGEARVRTDLLGLTGHQLVGGLYTNKTFASLDQSLRIIVLNRTIARETGSWGFYYNFDQYLYEPVKGSGKGIGIFGRFGITDGNPNLMHRFYSIGVGGSGVVPRRPLDSFGIAYYYIDITNPTLTGLLRTRKFLRDEHGFEAYYNVAITPWLRLTPDVQVVTPGQKEEIKIIPGFPPRIVKNNVETAVVLGARLGMVF